MILCIIETTTSCCAQSPSSANRNRWGVFLCRSTEHSNCNTLHLTASHCIILQHIAHCNTLQHTTTNTLQHTVTHCNILSHTATLHHTSTQYVFLRLRLGAAHHTAIHCTLQHIAHCNTLQHTATNTLQHIVTHRNILSHTATLHHTSTHYVFLRLRLGATHHTATDCNRLQQTATNTLQHTVTHCNILSHTATLHHTSTQYV